MSFLKAWRDSRRFSRLDPGERNIVFYSESKQDWHHFEPVIDLLTRKRSLRVCYVSSDETDPGLRQDNDRLLPFYIGAGFRRIVFFQMLKADVMVLTMIDLHNLQLKRSVHPVYYIYMFHSMSSTHMVDLESSYDHYDVILCVGPHQVREIRKREELAGLPPKELVEHGYPRLDSLMAAGAAWDREHSRAAPPTLLLAPTWGDDSILNVCGERLISVLLDAGYRVILRPHHQTVRLSPRVVESLIDRFGEHPRFEQVSLMGETESLFRSDLLICDWSSMSVEYALGLEKPVLFIDLPPRVRNPRYADLGIEPIEIAIRSEVGEVLSPDRLEDAPALVERLLANPEPFRAHVAQLRERWVFNLGRGAEVAATEIARFAARRAEARRERAG